MIKSRFRLWAYLVVLIFMAICFLCSLLANLLFFYPSKTPIGLYFLFTLILFAACWLFFGEMRKKAIVLKIEKDRFTINRFFGLSLPRTMTCNEIDGFKTSILSSKGGDYEYLYLIKNNHKVVKISEFYHRNYWDLKKQIAFQTKSLGFEKYNHLRELKEIFK